MMKYKIVPPKSDATSGKGSLPGGFFAALGIVLGGYLATYALTFALPDGNVLSGLLPSSPVPLGMLAAWPLVAMLGFLIYAAVKGQTRTVIGILLAGALVIGLIVLLVAACFSIMSNYHG